MSQIASLSVRIGADASELDRTLATVKAKFSTLGTSLQSTGAEISAIGSRLTASVTLPLVAAGGASTKLAMDFQSSMTKIETLVGKSSDQVKAWTGDIMAMAPAVGIGPKALADALFVVTSAGAGTAEALGIVEIAAKGSKIGLGETETVARAVTAAMQAYKSSGLSAAEATDILAGTVRAGNLEADRLAPVLGRVIGIASEMGVSFQEVGANIATYTRLGISAEEATTSLRSVLAALKRPSEDAKKAAEEVGLSFDELRKSVREKGLQATLADMIEAVGGNETALTRLIPSIEGVSGILGTAGVQGEAYAQVLDNINHSTGLVDEGFKRVSSDGADRMEKSLIRLQVASIKVGNVLLPLVAGISERIASLADRFSALDPKMQENIVGLGIFAAAIGPTMIIVGKLVGSLGTVIGVLAKVTALFNPVTLAILAAGAAALLVVKNWEKISAYYRSDFAPMLNNLVELWGDVKRFAVTAFEGVRDIVIAALGQVLSFWDRFGGALLERGSSIAGKLINMTSAVLNTLTSLWETWGGTITNLLSGTFGWILTTVGNVMTAVYSYVDLALGSIINIFTFWSKMIKGDWSGAWDFYLEKTGETWEGIKQVIFDAIFAIIDFLPGKILDIVGLTAPLRDGLASVREEMTGVKDEAPNVGDAVGGVAESFAGWKERVAGLLPSLGSLTDTLGGSVLDSVTAFSGAAGGAGGTTEEVTEAAIDLNKALVPLPPTVLALSDSFVDTEGKMKRVSTEIGFLDQNLLGLGVTAGEVIKNDIAPAVTNDLLNAFKGISPVFDSLLDKLSAMPTLVGAISDKIEDMLGKMIGGLIDIGAELLGIQTASAAAGAAGSGAAGAGGAGAAGAGAGIGVGAAAGIGVGAIALVAWARRNKQGLVGKVREEVFEGILAHIWDIPVGDLRSLDMEEIQAIFAKMEAGINVMPGDVLDKYKKGTPAVTGVPTSSLPTSSLPTSIPVPDIPSVQVPDYMGIGLPKEGMASPTSMSSTDRQTIQIFLDGRVLTETVVEGTPRYLELHGVG